MELFLSIIYYCWYNLYNYVDTEKAPKYEPEGLVYNLDHSSPKRP